LNRGWEFFLEDGGCFFGFALSFGFLEVSITLDFFFGVLERALIVVC